jgi:membrane associated rhomboid family serine protease
MEAFAALPRHLPRLARLDPGDRCFPSVTCDLFISISSFFHLSSICCSKMARFNIPPLTRSLLIILFGLTSLNALLHPAFGFSLFLWFATVHPLLGIPPMFSLKYIWTFLTATFVERNVWGLVTTSLTLFFGGRYLERAWGLPEFAKFMAVICAIPNILTWILVIIFHQFVQPLP